MFFSSCRSSSPKLVVFQFSDQYFRGAFMSSLRHFFARNSTRNLMLMSQKFCIFKLEIKMIRKKVYIIHAQSTHQGPDNRLAKAQVSRH